MFARLGQMALGNLDDRTLGDTMDNISALRKVQEDFDALKKELFKRLYGDVDTMEEDRKKEVTDFFDMLGRLERAEGDETIELEKVCRAAHPELYDLRVKEVKVLMSLLGKEVDVDIVKLDETAFVRGVLKGRKDANVNELHTVFAPLFAKKEKADADLSELDELLKD